jgi:hypothetical protein
VISLSLSLSLSLKEMNGKSTKLLDTVGILIFYDLISNLMVFFRGRQCVR